eukprot:m.940340 g.940340  ORF g.940340 m.940340 type:complete len:66 (+) comp23827_c0_seq6:2037-2234(+)
MPDCPCVSSLRPLTFTGAVVTQRRSSPLDAVVGITYKIWLPFCWYFTPATSDNYIHHMRCCQVMQ